MHNLLIERLLDKARYVRQTSYLTFTVIHPTDRRRIPSRHINTRHRHHIRETLQLIQQTNDLGWGAYVGVGYRRAALPRYQRGGKGQLLALPAIFSDVDRPPELVLPLLSQVPRPSLVIASGGGTHLYWFLKRPTTHFKQAERIIKGLARWLEADLSMSTDQIMRLPGTRNTKPKRANALCQVLSSNAVEYELDDFFAYELLHAPLKAQSVQPNDSCHVVHRVQRRSSALRQTLNPDLAEAVLRELVHQYGATPKGDGWYACYCPFPHHKDRFPGDHAYYRPDIGLFNCFGKHGQHLLHELASQLGIDVNAWGGIYRTE